MKKIILIFVFSLISLSVFASDWKEVQCIEIPQGTPVYYNIDFETGKTKYCIYIQGHAVNVSETNAKEFSAGRRRLELVKWYSKEKDAYKYTIRQLKLKDVDLNQLW